MMLVLIGGACLQGCTDNEVDTSILRAIPTDASIIIKTANFTDLVSTINNNNVMWQQLSGSNSMQSINKTLTTLDTILINNSDIRGVLRDKAVIISLHMEGKDKIRTLCALEIPKNEAQKLCDGIARCSKQSGLIFGHYKHDNSTIYAVTNSQNTNNVIMSCAYADGLFVMSTSKLSTEQSVRHIHSRNSIGSNRNLRSLLKSEGKNASAVIILNYKNLNDIINTQLAQSTSKIARQGEWGVMDMNVSKQHITLAGFSNIKESQGNYLKIIEGQQPVDNGFVKYLPSKTNTFVSLGIGNMEQFVSAYHSFLKERDGFVQFRSNNEALNKKYGINLEEKLYSLIVKRVTQLSCNYNLAGRQADKYIIAETSDKDKMADFLQETANKYCKANGIDKSKFTTSVTTTGGKKYTVYQWPFKKVFSSYFSDLFTNEVGYVAMHNKNVVFASTASGIREYINYMERRKTLDANSNYIEFMGISNTSSNLYFYADIFYSQAELKNMLSKANAQDLAKNNKAIKNFRSAAIQYSHVEGFHYYTSAALLYNPILEDDRYVSWVATSDTTILMKPQLVKNHTTGDREVLVQDETNKLYLFDKEGNPLWKKQIPEPITSQIFQIDYYGNQKLQYLFATENFLHLLDRNGNYIQNYPVKLPARVSTEISVYDYDGDGNYRIFVPCSNKHLYLYTKEGQPLPTWPDVVTSESLITPVQYFKIGDNDYLVSADILKTYILNRRGEIRINVTNDFPKAKNTLFYVEAPNGIENARFVTTNSSGELIYISMNGSCKSNRIKSFSADHYFIMQDINNDGENEYIFTDGKLLEVYSNSGRQIFYHNNDERIGRPYTFKFGENDVRIGVTSRSMNRVYLFHSNGKMCDGFPLQGTSEFSITKLNNRDRFSLLTGSTDNYLYNYLIQ